jgi:hypothetical protein
MPLFYFTQPNHPYVFMKAFSIQNKVQQFIVLKVNDILSLVLKELDRKRLSLATKILHNFVFF